MKNKAVEINIVDFIKENTKYDCLYWYPLNVPVTDMPVIAYDIDKIYDKQDIDYLRQVMDKCSIVHAERFQMGSSEYTEKVNLPKLLYEKDEDGYNFPWCVEAFYFDQSRTWMIYVSHEGTITFTGCDIVDAARTIIPDEYLYCLC